MALERLTIILRSLLTLKSPGDQSRPLISCTCNPCQSTGTSSLVSTGDPVLSMQVINGLDWSSGFLIILVGSLERDDLADQVGATMNKTTRFVNLGQVGKTGCSVVEDMLEWALWATPPAPYTVSG